MIETCNETGDSLYSVFLKYLNAFGQLQTAESLIKCILLIAFFVLATLFFTKRVNAKAKSKIDDFIRIKKYEPKLFIELNENLELLRYFLFANKWKSRIIHDFNTLFKGYEGKKLIAKLRNKYTYHLCYFSTQNKITETLDSLKKCFETLRGRFSETYRAQLGDYYFVAMHLGYDYINCIENLQMRFNMIKNKCILLVGSAGNGKTNLLCKISEIAVRNNIPVLLINARDIDTDCKEYIIDSLPNFPGKSHAGLYLRLISVMLAIQRKNFYILIDAINENDRKVFSESIARAINFFAKYSRIRILLTCRSEYFEARYKKYFNTCDEPPYLLDMTSCQYDDRAKKHMLKKYKNYFKVNSRIPNTTIGRLFKSLLLMRIFFEVNQNSDSEVLQLCNYEIYDRYLKKINSEIQDIDFDNVLMKIAKIMVETDQYDYVFLEDLDINGKRKSDFYKVLDNNLIICRKLITGKGITESSRETVQFVFDEFRDYCLARYILRLSEDQKDGYEFFFQKVDLMFEKHQSPVEGVIKFAYYHFKQNERYDLSRKVLDLYSDSDAQKISGRGQWYEKEYLFTCFGLSLIFLTGGPMIKSEIDFLKGYVARRPENYWNMVDFLLANEYSKVSPRADLAIKLLIEKRSYKEVSDIFDVLQRTRNELFEYRRKYYDIQNLCEWIKYLNEEDGGLSIELKQFLSLVCIFKPYEYELYKYRRFILEEAVCDGLIEKITDFHLQREVRLFRKRILTIKKSKILMN